MLEHLGEDIETRRRQLRLTQEELASLAGCSVRFIRSLEDGKSTVQLDKVTSVLEALGLELTTRRRDSA